MKNHCEDVGRDYEKVGKSLFVGWPSVFVTEAEDELTAYLTKQAKQNNISEEKLKKRFQEHAPGILVGHTEEVLVRFQYLIDIGFDYFQVMFPGINKETLKASQVFAKLVMKKL